MSNECDNGLLVALTLVERVKPQLKMDKREQINRVGLQMISQSLAQALERITRVERGSINDYTAGSIVAMVEIIEGLLKDETYYETDLETKELLVSKLEECLGRIYLDVGKYYMTHEFQYSIRMSGVLDRIVDTCVEQGYYFGVDQELRKRGEI